MAKYEPLRRYLRQRRGAPIVLSFADIERIIGAMLPNAAREAAWWTNQPAAIRGFVQCQAWLEAGYHAQPTLGRETLVRFVPIRQGPQGAQDLVEDIASTWLGSSHQKPTP